MPEPALESLFDDFRRRGDAEALAEVFDRTAPELLRVARHLAGGAGEAEDLVQSTYVAAMERARRFDARRGLMPWLLGILANKARQAERGRGRQLDPMRLARASAPEPGDELERRELRAQLEAAIKRLPAPYARVVDLHLVHARRAVEIAGELGRAPGTVRMQLARGLALLRRSLPASVVAGGALLHPPARGLAALRADVLVEAASLAPRAGVPIASMSLVTGGALVSMKLVGALAGAGVALALAWLAWKDEGKLAPDREDTAQVALDVGELPGVGGDSETNAISTRVGESERSAIARVDEEALATVWRLEGRVSGLEARPWPLLTVSCEPLRDRRVELQLSPTGEYELDLAPFLAGAVPSHYEIQLSTFPGGRYAGRIERVRIAPEDFALAALGDQVLRHDLEVDACRGFTGVVLLADGTPAAEAWLMLVPSDQGGMPASTTMTPGGCDEGGRFELATLWEGRARLAVGARGHALTSLSLELPVEGFTELEPIRLGTGEVSIEARVELPASLAAREVTLQAERVLEDGADFDLREVCWLGDHFEVMRQEARGLEGEPLLLAGLTAGASYELTIVDVDGAETRHLRSPLVVVAPAAGIIVGRELGAIEVGVLLEGAPASGPVVSVHAGFGWDDSYGDDETGVARLLVDRASDVRLVARFPGRCVSPELELPAATRGSDVRCELTLECERTPLSRLILEPTMPTGETLLALSVHFDRERRYWRKAELEDGRFVLEDVVPGRYIVELEPFDIGLDEYCASYCRCAAFVVELEAGAEVVHAVDFELGGRIRLVTEGWEPDPRWPTAPYARLEVRDELGSVVETRAVIVREGDDGFGSESLTGGDVQANEPSELYPTLPPGIYEVRFEYDDLASSPVLVRVEPGRTVDARIVVGRR